MRASAPLMIGMAAIAAVTSPAQAHHSFRSQYDAEQTITLTGVVTRLDWMNPHVYFFLDITAEDTGELETWAFEMGAPHLLQRIGWKRNTMQVGETVTVNGTRARDGSKTVNALRVTVTASGEVLGAASSQGQTIE